MSSLQPVPVEQVEYLKRRWLQHLADCGKSPFQIETFIINLGPLHPLRAYYVEQWVASLPEEEREAALQRLQPSVNNNKMVVTVLTAPNKPSFVALAALEVAEIDYLVLDAFGLQEGGIPHTWYGIPVNKAK